MLKTALARACVPLGKVLVMMRAEMTKRTVVRGLAGDDQEDDAESDRG